MAAHVNRFSRIGGNLALDFANTAGWHASESRLEHLAGYGDVLAWAREQSLLSPAQVASLAREAERSPRGATQAYHRALAWREAIYRVFTSLAGDGVPAASDLAALHAGRLKALQQAKLNWDASGKLELEWSADPVDLERPLYPVILAAFQLLDSPGRARLHQCGNHPCGWLFIDTTRSGTRRWCSSAECGNASRVRRFREKRRGGR